MLLDEKTANGLLQVIVDEKGRWTLKLETIEVDVKKKIFKINGIPFGGDCCELEIFHSPEITTIKLLKGITIR